MDMTHQFPALETAAPEQAAGPEGELRQQTRKVMLGVGILVPVLLAAATLIPIGGAVIGSGQVGMESSAKRVTHPNGGVIAYLFVRNGDRVKAGDPLLRFDDGVTSGQSEISALSVDQLLAKRARLEAEQLSLPAIRFPDSLLNSNSPGAKEAMEYERRLFVLRQVEEASQRAQLGARVTQLQREISGYRIQIGALNQQSALIEPERKGVQELWDRGLVTISRKNELERTAVDLKGNVGALYATIAQTEARIGETRQQIVLLGQQRRADAGTELATVNAALNEQQLRNIAAADSQNRSVVKATYPGVVEKLAFSAVGSVVRPAEPIMEIVPVDDNLIVEAAISPNDIEQVQVGQPARIRFTSINSTATPEIAGKVFYVAADPTVRERDGSSFFPVRVRIDAEMLKRYPELKLRQGMPAEAYIETGSRSMLSYLTKPLRDQFARAFRDN